MKSAVTASRLIYECMLIRLSLLRVVQAKKYDPLRLLRLLSIASGGMSKKSLLTNHFLIRVDR